MNKLLYNLNSILIVLLIASCSCSDNVILEESPDSIISRSVDNVIKSSRNETYYYYHHERTYVEVDTTKEYIIMRNRSAMSRSTNNSSYNEDLYNYTGYIVNKSEVNTTLTANDKYTVMAVEDVIINDIPLSPYIYVSLKNSSDIAQLTKLAE